MNDLIKIENGNAVLDAETSAKIAYFEQTVKGIKAKEDELKAAILKEMEAKGIIKIDTPEMAINYIASTDRERFDSKAFRKDHPDTYDEYVRISTVKPSIRIKVK